MTARWLRDLMLGARLALAGGREGRLRAGLTALGIGLGAAMLLLAAAVPAMLEERDARDTQRTFAGHVEAPADDTLLVRQHVIEFREHRIRGLVVRPEGPHAPVPPGMITLPGDGELVASPALARLLDSPAGELLRPRLDHPVVGLIGDEGLSGPRELRFYLGDATLETDGSVSRGNDFGSAGDPPSRLTPMLMLLLVIGVVALLLPVVMFVAVAARSGGEQRDRRLAALRLVGADAGMTRRIAAGEALVAAVLGLGVGVLAFLTGRMLVERVAVGSLNVFAADVRPQPALAALVLLAVPVLAVVVTMLAMRGVIAEPLGVMRRHASKRRRLWWRLALPAAGAALLLSMAGQAGVHDGHIAVYQAAAGAVLTLLGVAALLPWLMEWLLPRLPAGTVSWQLAVRRLQAGGGGTGRVVTGVAVAAAGAIALQMVFGAAAGVSISETSNSRTGNQSAPWVQAADPTRLMQARLAGDAVDVPFTQETTSAFADTPGARSAAALRRVTSHHERGPGPTALVGDCAALAALVTIDTCGDGDVFLVAAHQPDGGDFGAPDMPARTGPTRQVEAGQDLTFRDDDREITWQVPAHATTVGPLHTPYLAPPELLATPGAGVPDHGGDLLAYVLLDPDDPDAAEHVRNTAASMDWYMNVYMVQTEWVSDDFLMLRRALLAGVALTLLLVGLSLAVNTVEQLQERRRQLATLTAFGARRRTLAWSVLWQTALPVTVGLLLATVAGLGLGSLLLSVVSAAKVIDSGYLAVIIGVAAAMVLVVNLVTLPVLWRLMRPGGLRTE